MEGNSKLDERRQSEFSKDNLPRTYPAHSLIFSGVNNTTC